MNGIKNLTPHTITILRGFAEGEFHPLEIPASGQVARVAVRNVPAGVACPGIPLWRQETGEVTDLPDEEQGVLLLVSMAVRVACPDRLDLASPGELVRDAAGQPIGCRGLVVNQPVRVDCPDGGPLCGDPNCPHCGGDGVVRA